MRPNANKFNMILVETTFFPFTVQLVTVKLHFFQSNLVPRVLSYSASGDRVGEDPGNKIDSNEV